MKKAKVKAEQKRAIPQECWTIMMENGVIDIGRLSYSRSMCRLLRYNESDRLIRVRVIQIPAPRRCPRDTAWNKRVRAARNKGASK